MMLFGTIVSPSIAQMSPNFAQVCTTTCQMVLAPCTSKLARKFQKLHEKTQIYALIWTTSVWYNAKNCTKSLFTQSTPHFTGRSQVLLFFKPRSHFPQIKWISVDLSKTRQMNYKGGIVRILRGERNPHLTPCASESVEIRLHCPSWDLVDGVQLSGRQSQL